ncbi:MAG TPA: hypothetical protein VGO93_26790 [Candidatus Xenobia bacterium]
MRIKNQPPTVPATPGRKQDKGLLLIQIDGLSNTDLNKALDEGLMPNLKRQLQGGALQAGPYQCTQPSQTVVSQSGVLMGLTLPANQWFIKGGDWRMVNPMGLTSPDEVEHDLQARGDGGILQGGGKTYTSPLAGGADPKDTYFALSSMAERQHKSGFIGLLKGALRDFSHVSWSLLQHPTEVPGSIAHSVHQEVQGYRLQRQEFPEKTRREVAKEEFGSRKVLDGWLDDACTRSMEKDMHNGVPVLYKDYEGYDGRNHTYANNEFSRDSLKQTDKNIAILLKAAQEAPRKYNVVIYADHGCCPGVKFEKLNGQSFPDFVSSCMPKDHPQPLKKDDGTQLPPFLTQDIGSGSNIYFTNTTEALDRSRINKEYPGTIDKLKDNKYIAFVMTRDGDGTMLEGANGSVRIDKDQKVTVTGENPLAQFGEGDKMARQLHDMMHRPHQGDICVVGKALNDEETVNFGTLPGLHGGLGGNQQAPMIAFAPELGKYIKPEELTDSADLHQQLLPLLPHDSGLAKRLAAEKVATASA